MKSLSACLVCAVIMIVMTVMFASGQSSQSTRLQVNVGAECVVLPQLEQNTGTPGISFTYKIRTGTGSGKGEILMQVPNLDPQSVVSYRTQIQAPGVAYSGSLSGADVASKGVVIAAFGADAHSSGAGNSGSVEYSITPGSANTASPALSIKCQ